jgi:hypothetical protein
MINYKIDGVFIVCDKCSDSFRELKIINKKTIEKYKHKRSFCGRCIQERLHRNDPDWDYDKEFSYKQEPWILTKDEEEFLKALELFFM